LASRCPATEPGSTLPFSLARRTLTAIPITGHVSGDTTKPEHVAATASARMTGQVVNVHNATGAGLVGGFP
jgi:hypothetical protein